jgi:two-component system, NarL family, nitrate/nitrite response regulator NarL
MKPTPRILIVDRDSMSSDLLATALRREQTFEAVAVQSCDLLRALATHPCDLVVIASEVQANSLNGFELARAVGRAYPDVFIVILLNQSSHDSVMNAFRSGARGVFSREQPIAHFHDCVKTVVKGMIWAGKHESDVLVDAFMTIPALNLTVAADSPGLTVRELQVVQSAAKGKTNKAIAGELSLSEHTVKNYLFRAFEKLGVSSRVELLFYLTQRGHRFGPTKPDPADSEAEIEASFDDSAKAANG